MFELHPVVFTLGFTILTAIISYAVSWGIFKTKLGYLLERVKELEATYKSMFGIPEKVKKGHQDHTTFKSWVYNHFDKVENICSTNEKALIDKINNDLKELNNKRDLQFRELQKMVMAMEKNCASRQVYTQIIPEMSKDINNLKIQLATMPATLSKELSQSFSDEYQKIISIIIDRSKGN